VVCQGVGGGAVVSADSVAKVVISLMGGWDAPAALVDGPAPVPLKPLPAKPAAAKPPGAKAAPVTAATKASPPKAKTP
jgi:hypothetical protein